MTAEPFVVMAKPVGSRCNLNCTYCYYLGTDQLIGSAPALRMDEETLETFIRTYIQNSLNGPVKVVQFTWHGGEPTLAGLDFYKRAVELQKKYLPQGWQCWNNLQTNGVLLDRAWCDFLAQEHFDVGLSLDGTAAIHDRYRLDAGGQGTYDRVHAAAERLLERGVRPDLLCTVTADAARDPLGVYRALRELDTGWMQFIPIVRWGADGRPTVDSVSPEGYGDFLCAIFDEWIYHDVGRVGVQLFEEVAHVMQGGSPTLCWMARTCGRVVVVEREGDVYSCDHCVDPEHRLGSLKTDGLRPLVDGPGQQAFGEAKRDTLTDQCRSCRYLPMCGGGCPRDRFGISGTGQPGQYYLCAGLYRFFRTAENRLADLARLRRAGTDPAEIPAAILSAERRRWQGVGRNDPCPCGSGKKAKACCWDRRP